VLLSLSRLPPDRLRLVTDAVPIPSLHIGGAGAEQKPSVVPLWAVVNGVGRFSPV
jgi:hypothetical protein